MTIVPATRLLELLLGNPVVPWRPRPRQAGLPQQTWPLLPVLPGPAALPHRTPDLLDLYLQRRKAWTRPEVKEDLRFEQFAAPR